MQINLGPFNQTKPMLKFIFPPLIYSVFHDYNEFNLVLFIMTLRGLEYKIWIFNTGVFNKFSTKTFGVRFGNLVDI